MTQRCFNCLENLTTASCQKCGFKNSSLKVNNSALKPGTLLDGRYYLGRVLGQGGFGITYIGSDEIMGGIVAVKEHYPKAIVQRAPNGLDVLTDNKSEFNDGLKKFTDEARALAKFKNHPNIVAVISYQRSNNTAYMIMEYVEGRTVKDILSGGKALPVKDSCEIILQALDGLSACHEQRLIHRDLTPDNIYITTQGKVKILDFGSARETVEGGENEFTQVLKKSYAPIEQFQHGQGQGPWTDIYSVGASFYRLVVGSPPAQNSVDRLLNDTLKLPSQIKKLTGWNPELEQVLIRSLKVRPEERYQSVDEFKVDLLNATLDNKIVTPVKNLSTKKNVQPSKQNNQTAQKSTAQSSPQSKTRTASEKKPFNIFPIIGSAAAALIIAVVAFNNFSSTGTTDTLIVSGAGSPSSIVTSPPKTAPITQNKQPERRVIPDRPIPSPEPPSIDIITPKEFYFASFILNPSNAKVFVNGNRISNSRAQLKPGNHSVKLIAPGYVTRNESLNISSSDISKNYKLTKIAKASIEDLDGLEKVLSAPSPANLELIKPNAATGLQKIKHLPSLLNKIHYKKNTYKELEFESSHGDTLSSLMLGLAKLRNTPESPKNLDIARRYLKQASDGGSDIAKGYLALSYSCSNNPENCLENTAINLLDSFDSNSVIGSYFYAKYFLAVENFKLANQILLKGNLQNSKIGVVANLNGEINMGLGNKAKAIQSWKVGAKVFDLQSMLNLGVYDNNKLYLENAYSEGLTDAKKYFALTNFNDEKTFKNITSDLGVYDPSDAAFLNALKIISKENMEQNLSKLRVYLDLCKADVNCEAIKFISGIAPLNTTNKKSISNIIKTKNSDLLPLLRGGLIYLEGEVLLQSGAYSEAAEKFVLASNLGDLNSEVTLCNLYTFTLKNNRNAIKYCDSAYNKGSRSPLLLNTLAYTYIEGKEYRNLQNLTKAQKLLETSCSLGYATSCCVRAKHSNNNGDKNIFLRKAQSLSFQACEVD